MWCCADKWRVACGVGPPYKVPERIDPRFELVVTGRVAVLLRKWGLEWQVSCDAVGMPLLLLMLVCTVWMGMCVTMGRICVGGWVRKWVGCVVWVGVGTLC